MSDQSTPPDTCSPIEETEDSQHFLTVNVQRLRALSDPVLHFSLCNPPEIRVIGEDGQEHCPYEDDDCGGFLQPPSQRPRSSSCPEDLFRLQKGRPPTPPPTDLPKKFSKKRFSFNFQHRDGISFVHHKLGKLSEMFTETPPTSPSDLKEKDQTSLTETILQDTQVEIHESCLEYSSSSCPLQCISSHSNTCSSCVNCTTDNGFQCDGSLTPCDRKVNTSLANLSLSSPVGTSIENSNNSCEKEKKCDNASDNVKPGCLFSSEIEIVDQGQVTTCL